MSSTGTLETGTVVAGRYRIDETLGGEGSSAAYRATDLRLERAVGLRALPPSQGAQHGKAAARLVHPNVARVLDFGPDAELGLEFVVADLGTGGSLAALLAQRGTPPLPLAMRIVQEAAAGMAVAHRAGLVHGDLHPGVLWLSRDEGRLRVQVLGLGLNPAGAPPAKVTARYASPERLRRGRELAPAADVFSLGVVAYEVFAGLPAEWTSLLLSMARGQAVMAPSLLDTRPDLPAHVAQAVRRALLADPAQRWPDAGELAAHLIAESAAAHAPQPAPAPVVVAAPAPEPPVTAASFAAHVAEAAAPADDEPVDVTADAAEPVATDVAGVPAVAQAVAEEPVDAVAAAQEPEPAPAAEPVVVADAPAVAAPVAAPVIEDAAPAEPIVAPAPRRQAPARAAKPIVAAKTDLADSLYIPPALEKPAARVQKAAPEPAAPIAASAPRPAPVPPPAPEPLRAQPEPVIARIETVPVLDVAPAPAPPPVVAPVLETVALAIHKTEPLAIAEVDAPSAELIPIPERRRSGGLARLGQPTGGGQRRALLAASIATVVLVGGAVVARTVLAGPDATVPAAQGIASPALAAAGSATPQAQQPAAQAPVAPLPPVDSAAREALTPEERARQDEERRKLEEQRRLQQRQRDSLRQAQQLAVQQAQQAAAAPQQVALAAPRPAASTPAPQMEQPRAPAATVPAETAAPPPSAPARPRADPSRVYGGGEVDQPPSLSNGSAFRSAVNRTYPATLRNSGQWGNALVSFTVGTDGRVERGSISVDQASHPAFRAAAAAAIAAARFNPARVDGQPVRAQVSMPITWQGGGQEDED